MAHPMWVIRFIIKSFPRRFAIARLSKIPGIRNIIDKAIFEGDDILFLPQDVAIDVDKSFDAPINMVLPSQVVEHFIDEAQCHWIMSWCICRKSSGCKHYPVGLGCLFLGEAASKIDPRLGRRVTKEEALEHVKKCRDAGLVQLIGRNKLDAVWLDVRPSEKLLTICNCCPCCCLWKILPHLHSKISSKVTKMPGVSVCVVGDCKGCGTCVDNCFVSAIEIVKGKAEITSACRGCGRCVTTCPENAIRLTIAGSDSIAESIVRVSSAVDVH